MTTKPPLVVWLYAGTLSDYEEPSGSVGQVEYLHADAVRKRILAERKAAEALINYLAGGGKDAKRIERLTNAYIKAKQEKGR